MTTHITARLAWHADGWNGHVCKDPAANTFCVGQQSYPGTMIGEQRDLAQEQKVCGQGCSKLGKDVPPCMYSINAFGQDRIHAFADTPEFFRKEDRSPDGVRREWDMPPSSCSIWPYEEMYKDEVKLARGGYDPDKRLAAVRNFFAKVEVGRSLVFYYANFSNPFSEEDNKRYVLLGVSRVKALGEELFYDECSQETIDRYGGFVWQRVVSSHYPDQGMRIPYHRYTDKPEVLEQILAVPANPRVCKYAARHVSDDDALILVEQLLGVACRLQELGDDSENWGSRISWLQSVIAELWQGRGLYPGLPAVLDVIGFQAAIPGFVKAKAEEAVAIKDAVFAFLDGTAKAFDGLALNSDEVSKVKRQWQLRTDEERALSRDLLPRFGLDGTQVRRLLGEDRTTYGLPAKLSEIIDNPYILCESYIGDGPDDTIGLSKIEHGIFPSPNIAPAFLYEVDDWRRLRAFTVGQLLIMSTQTFLELSQVLHDVNHDLSFVAEWKRHQFTERYYEIDKEHMLGALEFREHEGQRYVYLRSAWEDEQLVSKCLRELNKRADISFKVPLTESHWGDYLRDDCSILSRMDADQYREAIEGQIAVCQQIFVRPLCVLAGSAGTGKTTVIRSLIHAVERVHGSGASFQLLAPTGKAADRIREKTGKAASTIHSFLAQRGWLNDNLTFKRQGGFREEGIETYIVDESSMLDLTLVAALFRAINWNSVRRLILVGDPSQLPPIGRGKVFADLIDWLGKDYPECLGTLCTNVRQMENRLQKTGTGIIDLASLFILRNSGGEVELQKAHAEQMLARVQEGGKVDEDLQVIYWSGQQDLEDKLVSSLQSDMQADTGLTLNNEKPYELWRAAFKNKEGVDRPEQSQVISPYRGEFFGTDHLNGLLQVASKGRRPDPHRLIDGVALFDKVMQIRNRSRSKPLWAWDTHGRSNKPVEVFNGELGFVKAHALDGKNAFGPWFRIKHFQVLFSRKESFWIGYGRSLGKTPDGKWIGDEKVEDNLELAYAISVHKSQGSEFERVYFVLPKSKQALLSPELLYTGLTRAKKHCTLLIEEDLSPLLTLRRPEASHLVVINSSLFDMRPVSQLLSRKCDWYEEGKIHHTLAQFMVRSKSEVIIANMLFERELPFEYEQPLYAKDGTFYLPDFLVHCQGQTYIWEHWGMISDEGYRNHRETKLEWYEKHFPGQLIETFEGAELSMESDRLIRKMQGAPE